ncbi:MAG: ABC transporter permease, partial [Acidimicrobiia bacterium]
MSGLINALVDMFDTATIASIVAGASALMFATMGETISEKAGVINLSVDGSMMLAALAGFVLAYETGTVWFGFPAAAAVGAAIALLVAFGSIKLSLNQVAVGFVLFALCTELSRFLGQSYVGNPPVGVPAWGIPGLSSIPFFGPVMFDHNLVVYLAYITVIVTYLFMYRTRKGLELQGIGERPEAAHSRG